MCRTNCFPKKGDIITLSQGAISVLIIRRCILLISSVSPLSRFSGLGLKEPHTRGLGPAPG